MIRGKSEPVDNIERSVSDSFHSTDANDSINSTNLTLTQSTEIDVIPDLSQPVEKKKNKKNSIYAQLVLEEERNARFKQVSW